MSAPLPLEVARMLAEDRRPPIRWEVSTVTDAGGATLRCDVTYACSCRYFTGDHEHHALYGPPCIFGPPADGGPFARREIVGYGEGWTLWAD